ncbi:uncharacterized protein [Centruroides vittatus]|uniref:uncharacterized protein n=1 Tax=Centruroides vittatus TaxID=120091 RepID=UPI00350EEB80
MLGILPPKLYQFRISWDNANSTDKNIDTLIERLRLEEDRLKEDDKKESTAQTALILKQKSQDNNDRNQLKNSGVECFKCGQKGHVKKYCKNKPCQKYLEYCRKTYNCNNCNQKGISQRNVKMRSQTNQTKEIKSKDNDELLSLGDDDAEPSGQQVTDCSTKLDGNCLGTKCFPSNKEDLQFPDKYSKRRKFIEFCRNAFYKLCCCRRMSGEISDSRNCELEHNLARSQIRQNSSKYDEHILNENYEFEGIGNGNFGTVYLARCKNSDDKVALKAVKMKRFCLSQRRELKREKTAWTSASSHPHIVTLMSCFKMSTSYCFVSEYVDGQDLTTYIRRKKFLEVAEAKILAAQVASAITFIHNKGDFLNLFIYSFLHKCKLYDKFIFVFDRNNS